MTAVRNPACLFGGLALLATTVVPFLSRQGQLLPIGRADLALTPLALANQYPGFWLLIGLALAWVALGVIRQDRPDRPALWGGLTGCLLVFWLTVAAGIKPYAFGLGSLLAMTVCLLMLAYGLSQGGYIRADTFVAASILLLGFFVLLFIIYPILAVLQHSVMDGQGAFHPGLFLETLQRYQSRGPRPCGPRDGQSDPGHRGAGSGTRAAGRARRGPPCALFRRDASSPRCH